MQSEKPLTKIDHPNLPPLREKNTAMYLTHHLCHLAEFLHLKQGIQEKLNTYYTCVVLSEMSKKHDTVSGFRNLHQH